MLIFSQGTFVGRLLLILGLLFLGWIAYRFLKNTWSARIQQVERKEGQNPSTPKVQQIKACAYCKTHIPEDEGIYNNGQFFCSYQHLDYYQEHEQKK